jgi:hypothetical protein
VYQRRVYQFREATARDREAILALRQRCYGDVDPEKRDPQFWDWEFAKARVFAGEDATGIVTHLAFVPYAGCDPSIRVVVAVDAMTAPEARGGRAYSGLVAYANDALRDDFDAIHGYQIRKAVLGAMLRNGWVSAESIPVHVRPASFRALLKWNVTPRKRTEGAESLARDNAAEMARLARTREFIEWRFFDNPRWSYRVTGARDREGRLVAWLVSRRTLLKSFDTQAIVDVAFTDARAARYLIRDAIAEAKSLGCALVAAFASRAHPARALLRRSFFIPGPHRFRLLVYSFGRTPRRESWQVTWADTDHL